MSRTEDLFSCSEDFSVIHDYAVKSHFVKLRSSLFANPPIHSFINADPFIRIDHVLYLGITIDKT